MASLCLPRMGSGRKRGKRKGKREGEKG